MAIQYMMKDDDPYKIIKKEKKGNKLAQNLDPGNYYRRKAKMDADADMIGDDFQGDGKKILDRLLNKKNKRKGTP